MGLSGGRENSFHWGSLKGAVIPARGMQILPSVKGKAHRERKRGGGERRIWYRAIPQVGKRIEIMSKPQTVKRTIYLSQVGTKKG